MPTLREILADPSDFNVCEGVSSRIIDRYNNDVDVGKATQHESTVVLVWQSLGIIQNGGFRYLLECDFKGDPDFRKAARAFRTIGCQLSADAFDQVLALFPKEKPLPDMERRTRTYCRKFTGFPNPIDSQFFGARGDEIAKRLAHYIRQNASEFAHLE